jgi:DNA-binding response OmpR family regulator
MLGSKKPRTGKILVIDDEPEITEIIATFLTEAGYQVETENSGMTGLEKAKEFKPDLILLDIMMPFMDGYEVCEELKKISHTKKTPVVFLTAKDSRSDEGRSFRSGGDMFIKKPFSCERLLEMVKVILLSVNR